MREGENVADIFMAIRGRLARAVQHIVPPKEIEDIVQETYLRICQVGGKTHIQSPRSFMFKTARNLALDHVKKAETRLADSFDEMDESGLQAHQLLGDSTLGKACSDEEFAQSFVTASATFLHKAAGLLCCARSMAIRSAKSQRSCRSAKAP